MEQAQPLFRGTAAYYERFRVPYPREVFDWITNEYRLDGRGRLLDGGCGTGQVALPLSHLFDEVIALDPDEQMLRACERAAHDRGVTNIRFLNSRTEEVTNDISPLRLATFGASFHWMDRVFVAERLYNLMEPTGGIVAISPSNFLSGREPWQAIVIQTIKDWLGQERRAGAGLFKSTPLHQECLAQTPFTNIKLIDFHTTHVWTIDNFIGFLYSTSFASRAVLGDLQEPFEEDLRNRLSGISDTDRFVEEIEFSIVSARPDG
jgi:SAM-dependent methyltransferase